jgi:hypothetical protein
MKNLVFILFLFISISTLNAQGILTFFADDGVRFWVSINGEKKNTKANSNVKIPTNSNTQLVATILFENQELPEITKTVYSTNKGEIVYRVRKNNRGKYVVRLYSVPQDDGFNTDDNDNNTSNNNQNWNNNHQNNNRNNDDENININIGGFKTDVKTNENEINMNVGGFRTDVKINDPFDNSNWNNNNPNSNNNQNRHNCFGAMPSRQFETAFNSLKNQSFEDSKLKVAKQISKNNCLSVNQIKTIMKDFSFEDNKLDFAKFAYQYAYDKQNYYLLNDAFDFSTSVDTLNDFLESQK